MAITRKRGSRGSALLAVLWLSAALAAIAFAMSTTVRGETERTSTAVDGLRCYYLATSAIDRASLEVLWSVQDPQHPKIGAGVSTVDYHFASGDAHVEMIPEAAKLSVNKAPPETLYRLGLALGIEPGRAREIAAAIEDWRQPAPQGSVLDQYYLSLGPTFRPAHASFQEIEELLLVKGVTPDIFYGTYVPTEDGRLLQRPGLVDCLSVYGSEIRVDANTAQPAVLAAIGMPAEAVSALVERRRLKPLDDEALMSFLQVIGAGGAPLGTRGHSIITIRATARLRLANGQPGDLKRTVAAQVKYMPPGYESPVHILRWYDTAWSN